MPTVTVEQAVWAERGREQIAGLDEAGRGALAGPVFAAAVILPLDQPQRLAALAEVNDSKQLPARKREALFPLICRHALAWGIGSCPAEEIDQIGIMAATRQAMQAALDALPLPATYLLIDGRIRLAQNPLPQRAIIRGDSLCLSIAAASILAKVSRDRYMVALSQQYPAYDLARHKGYGTARHLAALRACGPSPVHRLSFSPLRQGLWGRG